MLYQKKKKKNPKANLKTATPQSLRARAMLLEPQANRRRLDWSSTDRRCRIDPVQTVIGDRSSPDCRRCHLPSSEIAHRYIASSLPQRPQPSGLLAWLLRCFLPQGISFFILLS